MHNTTPAYRIRTGTIPARYTNISLAHFFAALLVLVSHAFPLSGYAQGEWFSILTQYQITMGGFAVTVFFFTGGYLIAQSMCTKKTFFGFFKARCLRIFPPLICIAALSAFIIGPVWTTLPLKEYFTDSATYQYLLNGIMILRHNLPGVFTQNVYGPTVNGSLWTLPVEFLCYIACYMMYRLDFLTPKKCLWSLPAAAIGEAFLLYFSHIPALSVLGPVFLPSLLFYFGILFYIYRDRIAIKYRTSVLMLLFFIVLAQIHMLNLAMILLFPYILYVFCFGPKQYSGKLPFWITCNYEIYLLAFPIQQCVVAWFGGRMNPYWNILLCIPMTLLTAVLLKKAMLRFFPFLKK